jgi:hypothetical protein
MIAGLLLLILLALLLPGAMRFLASALRLFALAAALALCAGG